MINLKEVNPGLTNSPEVQAVIALAASYLDECATYYENAGRRLQGWGDPSEARCDLETFIMEQLARTRVRATALRTRIKNPGVVELAEYVLRMAAFERSDVYQRVAEWVRAVGSDVAGGYDTQEESIDNQVVVGALRELARGVGTIHRADDGDG